MTRSERAVAARPWRWRRMSRVLGAVGLWATITLRANLASAQASDAAATSRALFNEGRALATAGNYAAACPKFEESLRINRGIGTQFNLADCWEHLGRTASAWGEFLEVAAAARASKQSERETVARERAAALESKLSRVLLDVQGPTEGLEIRRDGTPVGAAAWKTPVPIDPGKHVVEATAPGKQPFRSEIDVPPTAGVVVVKIPLLESVEVSPASPAPGVAPSTPTSAPPTTEQPPAAAPESSWSGQHTLALVAAGVGLVGAGVGTVFFLEYSSQNADAKDICPPGDACPPGSRTRHEGLVSDAKRSGAFAYAGWSLGVAGLTGAAVLWFTAPKPSGRAGTPRFSLAARPDGLGVEANGTW